MIIASSYLKAKSQYFGKTSLNCLIRSIKENNNDCVDEINSVPLKNPSLALALSIFLGGFGIDRFYVGDAGYAVFKIIFGFVACVILGFTLFMPLIALGVWLLDVCIIYTRTQDVNYNNILNLISDEIR